MENICALVTTAHGTITKGFDKRTERLRNQRISRDHLDNSITKTGLNNPLKNHQLTLA